MPGRKGRRAAASALAQAPARAGDQGIWHPGQPPVPRHPGICLGQRGEANSGTRKIAGLRELHLETAIWVTDHLVRCVGHVQTLWHRLAADARGDTEARDSVRTEGHPAPSLCQPGEASAATGTVAGTAAGVTPAGIPPSRRHAATTAGWSSVPRERTPRLIMHPFYGIVIINYQRR